MPRIVSDTQELHQIVETAPPTSVTQSGRFMLERLLACLCQIPLAPSLSETVAQLLRELHQLLPGYALGVRIPADENNAPILLTIPPLDEPPDDAWSPNAILFAAHPHERRVPLPCRPEPACLHCASDDPSLDSDGSPITNTVETCASALSTAIRFIDAQHTLQRQAREMDKLQRALIQSDKLASLGEISAGLVHELANPLTSIVAYTEYLLQKAERRGDDPEDIERLRRVGDAADLILSFTRAIVSYAKPGDDIPYPVDATQAIDQALLFCKHLIDDSRVTIKHQIEPDLPYVRAVRGQLIQVIVNLVANACQAMAPRGGTLTIRAHAIHTRQVVQLQIDDTGPGIDPEHIDRVFDPFFTTKEEGVGTGLGLNIVRQIVARSEGTVSVESHPGQGASFIVTLPVHSCEHP